MLSIERAKFLLKDSEFSELPDAELEVVLMDVRSLAEIIYKNWNKQKENENETTEESYPR